MQKSKFRIQNEHGFAPILVVGVVILVALFVFLFFFFRQNNKQLENYVSSDIPPGVVTDAEGNICETQDAEFCHETEDIETWKDDGLP
jgi:hypothetical protein